MPWVTMIVVGWLAFWVAVGFMTGRVNSRFPLPHFPSRRPGAWEVDGDYRDALCSTWVIRSGPSVSRYGASPSSPPQGWPASSTHGHQPQHREHHAHQRGWSGLNAHSTRGSNAPPHS